MKVHCPECQGTFRVEGHETGTAFRCPFCEAQFAFQDRETPVVVGNPDATVTTEDEPNLVESRFGSGSAPTGSDPAASHRAEKLGEGAPSGETPIPLKSVEKDSPNSAADTPSPSSSDPTRLLDDSARFPSAPSTPPEELTDIRPGDLIHGYRIEEIIGSGGMSVVFRATQASLGRNVAFKVLRKDLGEDEEFAERFRTEARALAELNHPNIVSVYEQGEHEGSYYLVMEFVDGVSLRDVMEERRLTPEEAFQIIPSLCSALEYAHTKNIIHRDIKPENILVDRSGTPRIADFGLVRIVGDAAPATRLTKTQTVLGTLDYMAPEQREGRRDIDHRADIYSLGVVLYEMLTGELPIARFPRPSERARLEHGIDDIVLKVLEKDRDRRYQRASMVARDLTRVQSGVRQPHPDHDSAPDTIFGRLVAMATSFSFFFFTAVYITVMALNGDDSTICLVTGMAVPFYLGSLVLNGILPRPVVRPKNFLVKHPVIAGGLLTFFTVLLLEERVIDREPGLFFAGLFVSYAVLVWCWRKKVFRPSTAEPAFVPWAGPPRGYEDLRAGKLPESARNFVGATADYAKAVARNARESFEAQRRSPAGGAEATPAAARAVPTPPAPPTPVSASAPSESTVGAPPDTKRFSITTLLSFLVMLPIILVTIALGVVILGLDGLLAPLQIPMDYREVSHMFRDLWSASLSDVERVYTLLSFLPPLLLLPPFVLMFIALPGIVSGKKRGGALYATTFVIFLIETMVLLGVSTHIHHLGKNYTHYAGDNLPVRGVDVTEDLIQTLSKAASPHTDIQQVALFHRASLLAQSVSAPLEARPPLIAIALNASEKRNVRIAALILLQRLYGPRLFDDPNVGDPPERWIETFYRNAEDDSIGYSVRTAFSRTIEYCNSSQF